MVILIDVINTLYLRYLLNGPSMKAGWWAEGGGESLLYPLLVMDSLFLF